MSGARIRGEAGTLRFTFDGREMLARDGDTLAAALLANGVTLVARSFKYHRPRGILSAGVEEPNALITVGDGGRREPNTRATDVYVYDGLVATTQNAWPSVVFDVGAVNNLVSRFLPAGFYYKTFFGPPSRWMIYERFIRKAAGLGKAPTEADPDRFEHRSLFCETLVIGAGAAGLAAARAGEGRVVLVEQARAIHGDVPAGVRALTRTTAYGAWDHGFVTLVEKLVEPGQTPARGEPAQRIWHVRAEKVVLATGAIERPLTFAGNDLPGVMLAGAVDAYIRRHDVRPGKHVAIVTNNDGTQATADAVIAAGGKIAATIDLRRDRIVAATGGKHGVTGITAVVDGRTRHFPADLVAMSGGWTPTVHLWSQAGGKLDWREDIQAFVPGAGPKWMRAVGAAAGAVPAVPAPARELPDPKHSFVDFQNDVSAADVDLAWREGYRSVEHLKRYTTLGMATDQGKTSNMSALGRLAAAGSTTIPLAGLTTFRAPFTPLSLGALAGADGGGHAAPSRRLALYDRHERLNPLWQPLGYWHRPRAYPVNGETLHQAAMREAKAVRTAAGIVDVSTLAKFAVKGPDAARFLEIVCATGIAKLAVGRGRYTFMCREDGMVMDDGTVWRLAENEYLLTSSTGGAERMEGHLSYCHRVLAPRLRVSVVGQQEHFAGIALAGPKSSGIVRELFGVEPPAHMGLTPGAIAAVPVLILAASYSGERAFEIYAAGHAAGPVWDTLEAAVRAAGGAPYGLEALEFLRIEKGHVVIGAEADGRTTPDDLGFAKMRRKAGGYVGALALDRPALADADRRRLVGLVSDDAIPEGAMLLANGEVQGHVTSAGPRVLEKGGVALALLAGGMAREGETLTASSPTRGREVRVTVAAPVFHDADGARYRD